MSLSKVLAQLSQDPSRFYGAATSAPAPASQAPYVDPSIAGWTFDENGSVWRGPNDAVQAEIPMDVFWAQQQAAQNVRKDWLQANPGHFAGPADNDWRPYRADIGEANGQTTYQGRPLFRRNDFEGAGLDYFTFDVPAGMRSDGGRGSQYSPVGPIDWGLYEKSSGTQLMGKYFLPTVAALTGASALGFGAGGSAAGGATGGAAAGGTAAAEGAAAGAAGGSAAAAGELASFVGPATGAIEAAPVIGAAGAPVVSGIAAGAGPFVPTLLGQTAAGGLSAALAPTGGATGGVAAGAVPGLAEILARGIPGVIGAFAADKQSDRYSDLAQQYLNIGAPSRARFEGSFAPGFSMANEPGYKDALDQVTKSTLHGLSVAGNPADSPNAWSQTLTDVNANFAFPALNEYRRLNAGAGGMAALTSAAPGAASSAINAEKNVLGALAGASADIFAPPRPTARNLEELLRQFGVIK